MQFNSEVTGFWVIVDKDSWEVGSGDSEGCESLASKLHDAKSMTINPSRKKSLWVLVSFIVINMLNQNIFSMDVISFQSSPPNLALNKIKLFDPQLLK